jgi:hypothetical protein
MLAWMDHLVQLPFPSTLEVLLKEREGCKREAWTHMKRERGSDAPGAPPGYWPLVELPHLLAGHLDGLRLLDADYRAAIAELVNLSEIWVAVHAGVDGAVLPEGVTVESVHARIAAAERLVLQLAAARLRAAQEMDVAVATRTQPFGAS